MAGFLEYRLDKFTFKVATDRLYSPDGLWAKAEEQRIRVGVSDFVQQRNGDVAFVDVVETGTALTAGAELATLETIKVDLELSAPISGTVVAVNESLEMEAELINQDPYGEGWLAIIEAADWPADKRQLLDAQAYFEQMAAEAEEEASD